MLRRLVEVNCSGYSSSSCSEHFGRHSDCRHELAGDSTMVMLLVLSAPLAGFSARLPCAVVSHKLAQKAMMLLLWPWPLCCLCWVAVWWPTAVVSVVDCIKVVVIALVQLMVALVMSFFCRWKWVQVLHG